MCTRKPGKTSDSRAAWARSTYGSGRICWGGRSRPWLTEDERTLVAEDPGNTHLCELSQRSPFWHWELAPFNRPQVPVLACRRPDNQQWEHSTTHEQTGCPEPSEPTATYKHTLWHGPTHRGIRLSSTYYWAGTSPSPTRKSAEAPKPSSPTRRGEHQTQEELQP